MRTHAEDSEGEAWLSQADFGLRAGLGHGDPSRAARALAAWRTARRPRGNPVPDPDDSWVEGTHMRPFWRESTVAAWLARRPGRGRVTREYHTA